MRKEAEDRKMYERIVDATDRYYDKEKIGGLWHDPDLQFALDWRNESYVTRAWADRYVPDLKFEQALDFLDKSRQKRDY